MKKTCFTVVVFFIDHTSNCMFLFYQVNLSASDTVKYNMQFKIYYFNMIVVVQAYHTDNGVLVAEKFVKQLIESNQKSGLSG